MTPTARSLAHLRRAGWTVSVVERWNACAGVRQDLFGFADILAIREGEAPLAIQATTASNAAARLKKALAIPALRVWLLVGERFEVWAWSKRGPRGKAKRWTLKARVVTLDDLVEANE